MFKMEYDESIKTMFSRFQILVSGLQIMNKSHTISDHVNKILRSLPLRYIPKVIAIQGVKDLNKTILESRISNL